MIYRQATEFSSDLQALAQRIPTLPADIERVKPRLVRIFAEPSETTVADFSQQLFACGKAAIIQQTAQCTVVQLCLDTDTAAYRRAVWLVVCEWCEHCLVMRRCGLLELPAPLSLSKSTPPLTKRMGMSGVSSELLTSWRKHNVEQQGTHTGRK